MSLLLIEWRLYCDGSLSKLLQCRGQHYTYLSFCLERSLTSDGGVVQCCLPHRGNFVSSLTSPLQCVFWPVTPELSSVSETERSTGGCRVDLLLLGMKYFAFSIYSFDRQSWVFSFFSWFVVKLWTVLMVQLLILSARPFHVLVKVTVSSVLTFLP